MKHRKHKFDPKKHDLGNLATSMYCDAHFTDDQGNKTIRTNVFEIPNPIPAFDPLLFEGEISQEERIEKVIANHMQQLTQMVRAKMVEGPEDPIDFDVDEDEDFSFRTEYNLVDEVVRLKEDGEFAEKDAGLPPQIVTGKRWGTVLF